MNLSKLYNDNILNHIDRYIFIIIIILYQTSISVILQDRKNRYQFCYKHITQYSTRDSDTSRKKQRTQLDLNNDSRTQFGNTVKRIFDFSFMKHSGGR